MSKNLLENYCNKIDELAPATFNEDQKILAKKILEKADEKDLQNIFQMLIQRIKIGFTFDVAPTYQKEDEQSVALLKKDENRSFKNYENTSNIENTLIIGENYDALKNLLVIERERESSSHSDAYYDVIYIDPPYNTESAKDDGNHLADEKSDIAPSKFVYRDKFSRNGWLNMLNERLRLAKQLLKDDGVIFVSIDDNEQAYLKVLMDEIFGEENFVVNFKWNKTSTPPSLSNKIRHKYEYILCYEKTKTNNIFSVGEISGGDMPLLNSINPIKCIHFQRQMVKFNFNGDLKKGKYNGCILHDDIFIKENYAVNDFVLEGPFKWTQKTINEEWNNGTKFIIKSNNLSIRYIREGFRVKKPSDIISMQECKVGTNEQGKKDLDVIIPLNKMNYPKPVSLINFLVSLVNKTNTRILDFFAGSGTTGHAVMELNREDNGKRTYTLVTNNENNIGYDVCYERLYRINSGKGTKGETNFKWLEKNEPYKQNLNIFNIEYYDTSILKKNDNDSITKIKKSLAEEIEEFGIIPSANFNVDIYYDLLSLKPILKEDR